MQVSWVFQVENAATKGEKRRKSTLDRGNSICQVKASIRAYGLLQKQGVPTHHKRPGNTRIMTGDDEKARQLLLNGGRGGEEA